MTDTEKKKLGIREINIKKLLLSAVAAGVAIALIEALLWRIFGTPSSLVQNLVGMVLVGTFIGIVGAKGWIAK